MVADSKRRFAGGLSLSPTSLRDIPCGSRLVLPSPNGSAAAWLAGKTSAAVFCGSLRNMRATALACRHYASVLVIACGEKWPNDTARFCIEDYVAAGGIVSMLERPGELSPEATLATLAYGGFNDAGQRGAALAACSSAVELRERGFEDDVHLCLQEDVSNHACQLHDQAFQ
jgi:2-phosphosulfolactate phosphatase